MRRYLDIEKVIIPAIQAQACYLVGLEYCARQHRDLLRIYIEKEGEDPRVTTEDCEKNSRAIGAALDVSQLLERSYLLEVSSPGVDRILFTVDQMQRYLNKLVLVKMKIPVQGRRNFKGNLLQADGQEIRLSLEDPSEEVILKTAEVDQVRVVPVW
ncbi:MAG: ribosome maturation factor RimP [Gammaproteobacteria bacterium]